MAKNLDVNLQPIVIIKPLIGCAALALLCAFMIHNGMESRKFGFDMSWFGLYFFAGLFVLMTVFMIVTPRPSIRLSEDGVHFRRFHRTPIPWVAVNSIGSRQMLVRKGPMEWIIFDIDKSVFDALPRTWFGRFMRWSNIGQRHNNFKIASAYLDVSHDILLGILHDYRSEYGGPG